MSEHLRAGVVVVISVIALGDEIVESDLNAIRLRR
jgi:hypothetical protein